MTRFVTSNQQTSHDVVIMPLCAQKEWLLKSRLIVPAFNRPWCACVCGADAQVDTVQAAHPLSGAEVTELHALPERLFRLHLFV